VAPPPWPSAVGGSVGGGRGAAAAEEDIPAMARTVRPLVQTSTTMHIDWAAPGWGESSSDAEFIAVI